MGKVGSVSGQKVILSEHYGAATQVFMDDVHIEGTKNVVWAARQARVKKILFMSFLCARPDCGSTYHESKWAAEEIVRASGLNYTVVKAGMVYGRGDHMLDHLSHALHTFPFFAMVGFREKSIQPLAIEDLVEVLSASLIARRRTERGTSLSLAR